MKIRKRAYGEINIVGRCVERLRKERGISQKDFISKMQTMGCDINPTSYSKLEGQVRIATDKEIYVIAQILNVTVDDLFEDSEIAETE
ncbi:MAG: helix-turn-helix transcriptional regulator [Clostridia bacterium]|nr:helix-turn-helix transcriptional regulator [Clostridia bacterium]